MMLSPIFGRGINDQKSDVMTLDDLCPNPGQTVVEGEDSFLAL